MDNDLLIREEIQGERLLFEERMNYSDKEKELIKNSVYARLKARPKTYPCLIFGYFRKILEVCGQDKFKYDDTIDSEILQYAMLEGANNKKNMRMMEESYDYSLYIADVCYGCCNGMNYPQMVANKILDVIGLRAALDDNRIYSSFSFAKPEFFITNNFLLVNYPDFYSDSDIEQLKNIDKYWVSKDVEAKRARKVMNRAINEWKQKRQEKAKVKTIGKK